jgi:hypothetical protein
MIFFTSLLPDFFKDFSGIDFKDPEKIKLSVDHMLNAYVNN